jgi:hypothetical protein
MLGLYLSPFFTLTDFFYTCERLTLTRVLAEGSGHQDAQAMLQSEVYTQ